MGNNVLHTGKLCWYSLDKKIKKP